MAVALVSVKVDDHKLLHAVPFLHVVSDKRDVWVDAEPAARRPSCVMESTANVDSPASLTSNTRGIDRSLRGTSHGVEDALAEEPARQEDKRQFNRFANPVRKVELEEVPLRHDVLQELTRRNFWLVSLRWHSFGQVVLEKPLCDSSVLGSIEWVHFFQATRRDVVL